MKCDKHISLKKIFNDPIILNEFLRYLRMTTSITRNLLFEVVLPNINPIGSKLVNIFFNFLYYNIV